MGAEEKTPGAQARMLIPKEPLAVFCRRHGIHQLSLFGSALRTDFSPDSDLDVLVEFEPGRVPGLIRLAGMELELSGLLGGPGGGHEHAELPQSLFS